MQCTKIETKKKHRTDFVLEKILKTNNKIVIGAPHSNQGLCIVFSVLSLFFNCLVVVVVVVVALHSEVWGVHHHTCYRKNYLPNGISSRKETTKMGNIARKAESFMISIIFGLVVWLVRLTCVMVCLSSFRVCLWSKRKWWWVL
mmetsp:Transcript_18954/g.26755  ORF Transcript_18954/g.26755 Transcript_18954/m.26755 type:complete len:144 (-) Transcript_18954:22-453(-)